ncbi:unnamed protein product, partial [Tetraodon nigroviridis]
RTMSVYGGAGGRGTRISSSQQVFSAPGGFNLADGLDLHVGANEKATMQNLNDRLAAYLEKVRRLEKENDQLEKQIRDWYQSKVVVCHDYTSYLATIDDLKDKIRIASKINAKTVLDIDNAKLAADDFKMKFENELAMRLAVEADIAGLKKVLDNLNLTRMDLESQYESLKDELLMLKRNHEEELVLLRSQMGGQVNVAVDATPSTDLNQVMSEIREHYEGVIAKNQKELEAWYQNKVRAHRSSGKSLPSQLFTFVLSFLTPLPLACSDHSGRTGRDHADGDSVDVPHRDEGAEEHPPEAPDRTAVQFEHGQPARAHSPETSPGLPLTRPLSPSEQKAALEGTLAETQARYAAQLVSLQHTVSSLEAQLAHIREDISKNKREYDVLLDLKTRLELEIAEYRRLLDGEDE